MTRPAVFFDKDGTLLVDVPYNVDPDFMCLAPGAIEATRSLAAMGYLIVVVSNQSGVARGYFPEGALANVGHRLADLLGEALHGFYYCPHHPRGIVTRYAVLCTCRKPAPGMLRRAANDLGIDLARSWMVGDILDDVEAGNRAGCRTILLDPGGETEWRGGVRREPYARAANLALAARVILAERQATA